ncbi:hypothetical protein, partial [Mycobacterium tuberculosis]|uniref:hypothetical protein n=1 Tax=Mycobacterium tuberculosis TaxID=1773 RepID=UPI001244A94B
MLDGRDTGVDRVDTAQCGSLVAQDVAASSGGFGGQVGLAAQVGLGFTAVIEAEVGAQVGAGLGIGTG